MAREPHFTPELFSFLRDLKQHNNRDWFKANKARFEQVVRDPLLRFVADVGPRLAKVSPHIMADPRPVGGSIFRIYRDTRFAKDKTPYKTNAGAQFRHDAGKDVHAPGYYLHLAPEGQASGGMSGGVFAGCGVWRPDSAGVRAIRDAIVDDPALWNKVTNGKSFKSACSMGGEKLKRPPRGFDAEHPLIEDLKRKDFIASTSFTEADACAPDFITKFARFARTSAPLMKFIAGALKVGW